KIVWRRTTAELHSINFAYAEARMREAERQVTVVGEEQKPSRIVIEPADGKDPAFLTEPGEIRRDVRPMLRVVQRSDHPGRFMKGVVKRCDGGFNSLAVDLDAVFEWIGLRAQF